MDSMKFFRASHATHRRVPGSLLLWFSLNRELLSSLGFSCKLSVGDGYGLG